jgi:hypothetical protein
MTLLLDAAADEIEILLERILIDVASPGCGPA